MPNLTNLVLSSNNIAELADLDVLGQFPRLTHLVLADNPITKKEVCSPYFAAFAIRRSGKMKVRMFERGAWADTFEALPLLGYLAMPDRALP